MSMPLDRTSDVPRIGALQLRTLALLLRAPALSCSSDPYLHDVVHSRSLQGRRSFPRYLSKTPLMLPSCNTLLLTME
jgi:hypothetical protein